MDTKTTDRKTRARTKSSSVEPPAPGTDEEMAPNVNGNKDGGNIENEAEEATPTVVPVPEVVPEPPKPEPAPSPPRTRKRKAIEMKTDEPESTEVEEKKPETPKEVINDATETPVDMETDAKVEEEKTEEKVEEATELKEIKLPEKQFLGKGKRARVPNKRYSDITVSKVTFDTPKASKNTENGQLNDSESGVTVKEESEADPSPAHSTRRTRASSPSSHSHKKAKTSIDLTNPNYLKPFEYGWKRELVYRSSSSSDNSLKRNGDIYYYTPSGKKVRSMREVAEHLNNKELSIDDFTFFKEPLGIEDPEKEIIRDAKFKSGPPIIPKKMTPKLTKSNTKSGSPKSTGTPSGDGWDTPKAAKSPRLSGFKVKVPKGNASKSKDKKAKENKDDTELEIGTYPPNWTSPIKKGKTSFNDADSNKPCRPCSIRCEGVLGLIPTLQCRICLCLYHNECVGIPPHTNIQGYVCKNCQLEQDPNSGAASLISPPPLTNVNTLKPVQSGVLPKLQRIPKPNDAPSVPASNTEIALPELPKLTPKPGIVPGLPQIEPNKNLLGSVTTWFPSSSTIQVGNSENTNSENTLQEPPRPQLVEFVGNKKYLIVPRHNILSVAPVAQFSEKPQEQEKLITDATCDIKVEPESPSKLLEKPFEISQNPFTFNPLTGDHQDTNEEANPQQPTNQEKANAETPVKTKSSARLKQIVERDTPKVEVNKFMDTYLQNLSYGYKTLLNVFQYLKVQDLLRAGCVCTMWRDVSRHPLLWNTVRMKNSQIHSFEGLANALQLHGTVHLDLRKMLLPPNGGDDIWPSFTNAIKNVESLRKIELCRCLASVVEELASNNKKLEAINAVTIKCESMTFEPFKHLINLTDLRLKSTSGLTLTSDLSALKELTKLKHLSITSIKDLNKLNIEVIGELVNLEVLDLGECADFPEHFGPDILSKLVNLEKLRLEKGQGECHTFNILEAVKDLKLLQQLELVNFDIKTGFDKALGACLNIKKLLIIPTYISQSATTNHMVLGGVLKLQKTLSHFVWGVTLELLRVTELFVDQCEQPDKKETKEKTISNLDSIPVLKPVPLHGISQPETPPNSDTPQVEILPLPNLQKLLLQNLPTTRVKILKIPFHATWRQSITDTVN